MGGADIVTAFLTSRRALRRTDQTLDTYAKHARSLLASTGGNLPDTVDQLEAWIATAPSPEYARARIRHVAAIYRWAARRGLVDRAFVAETFGPTPDGAPPLLERPKGHPDELRVFSEAELAAIWRVADRNAVDRAIVRTLLDTGIRVGGLASLRTSSLRPGAIAVVLKGGKTLSVPAGPETIRALAAIARPDPRDPIFPGRNGKPMSSKSMQNHVVRTILAPAGIRPPKGGPHTFRHTFATLYLANGGQLRRLQRILGHASITTTMRYDHVVDSELAAEHERCSPLADVMRTAQYRMALA